MTTFDQFCEFMFKECNTTLQYKDWCSENSRDLLFIYNEYLTESKND